MFQVGQLAGRGRFGAPGGVGISIQAGGGAGASAGRQRNRLPLPINGVVQPLALKAVPVGPAANLVIGHPQRRREAHGQPGAGAKARHRGTGPQIVEHIGRVRLHLAVAEVAAQGARLMGGLDNPASRLRFAQRVAGHRFQLLHPPLGLGRVAVEIGAAGSTVGLQRRRPGQRRAAHGQGRPTRQGRPRQPDRPGHGLLAHGNQPHPPFPTGHDPAAKQVKSGRRQPQGAFDAPGQDDEGNQAGANVEAGALLRRRRQQADHQPGNDDAHKGLDEQVNELLQVGAQKGLGVDKKGEEHGQGNA